MAVVTLNTELVDRIFVKLKQAYWKKGIGDSIMCFFFLLLLRKVTDQFIGSSTENIISDSHDW